jgi:hypothetical protein
MSEPKASDTSDELGAVQSEIGAAEAAQRLNNLRVLASGKFNPKTLSPQERAVARDLAKGMGFGNDLSKLSSDQWGRIVADAQVRGDELAVKQGAGTGTQAQAQMNPQEALSMGLVQDFARLQAPLSGAMSGALTAPGNQQAQNQALSALGLSAGSPGAQWLQGQINQGVKNDAPLNAAMQAYTTAYGQGLEGVDQAILGLGAANAAAIQSAPYQDFLQAVPQHLLSNWLYSGQAPSWASSLPPWLQQIMSNAVGGSTTASPAVPGAQGSQGVSGTPPQLQAPGATSTLNPGSSGSNPSGF